MLEILPFFLFGLVALYIIGSFICEKLGDKIVLRYLGEEARDYLIMARNTKSDGRFIFLRNRYKEKYVKGRRLGLLWWAIFDCYTYREDRL